MEVLGRFHEGREFPSKSIEVKLKKGFTIEICDWSPNTEDVNIYEKFVLDSYDTSDDKKEMTIIFKRVNLKKEDKTRYHLVNAILNKHFDSSKYGLLKSFIESMERAIVTGEISPKDLKEMEGKFDEIERNKGRTEALPQEQRD